MSLWVATTIVTTGAPKMQLKCLKRFIRIARVRANASAVGLAFESS